MGSTAGEEAGCSVIVVAVAGVEDDDDDDDVEIVGSSGFFSCGPTFNTVLAKA